MNKQNSYTLYLSERAKKDYKKIQRYTKKTYGKEQVLKYASIIKECLEKIRNNHMLGHSRPDIPENYKAFGAGEHFIIYRLEDQTVYVVAILHGSMDFLSQLSE